MQAPRSLEFYTRRMRLSMPILMVSVCAACSSDAPDGVQDPGGRPSPRDASVLGARGAMRAGDADVVSGGSAGSSTSAGGAATSGGSGGRIGNSSGTPSGGAAPADDASAGSHDGGGTLDGGGSGGASGGTGFEHPGILVSRGQLDFVKAKIAANAQPWKGELDRAKAGKYGRLPYTPHPITTMKCGNGSNPLDQGCTSSRDDATAAYTQALVWYLTGDSAYAKSAAAILDAWAELKEIVFDPNNVASDPGQNNGPLQAAWLAEMFPRSAEILRHIDSGWPSDRAAMFGEMMRSVLLPLIVDGWGYQANWNLSMADGMINIAVYTDDRALFDKGVARFRERVPLNMYLASDGAMPKPPSGYTTQRLVELWYGQSDFSGRSGHTQETCRDLSHTQMGLASTVYAAETAGHQGVDLYGEQQARIVAAFEYVARYLNRFPSPTARTVTVESSMCGGSIETHDVPVWELAYNAYAERLGVPMPESKSTRDRIRQQTGNYVTVTNLQIAWEALTHGDTGSAGY